MRTIYGDPDERSRQGRIKPMRIPLFWVVSWLLILSAAARAAMTPTINIKLAPEIRSEDVSISYVLYGSFGAAEDNVAPQPNVTEYRINPVHDGKLAASIKAVIYAPGCEFDTFELDITDDAPLEKSYECVALPTVSLVGHMANSRLYRHRDLEVVVRYLGEWQCRFFELLDCMVPQMDLGRAPVNENGEFELTIVDFSPEQKLRPRRKAELWVILRDAKTWNPIGEGLRPIREFRTQSTAGLAIRPFYPPPLEFEIVPTVNSVPRPPGVQP
jgi:hypothetical protein